MKNSLENREGTNTEASPCNRRQFIANTGKGLIAATILAELSTLSASGQQVQTKMPVDPNELKPIELSPLDAPTEKKSGPLPTPLSPAKRIRYALVGLGHLTLEELLPAFASCKYSKVTALVSGDAAKAAKVAGQYGIDPKNIYNYQNYDNIRNNPEIDAVYIVLPNSMHAEFTIRAAKAGKHVLCEKPMANSSKEAREMIDACKAAGKKLMIAYRIQYEPHNRLAKKWTREKKYGTVKIIEAVNTQNIGDPAQWRLNKKLAGGGALPDIGIYCLNTIRFLLGEEPVEVQGSVYSSPGDPRFKEVEEAVLWQMKFPSGVQANCTTSYGVHQARRYRCYADQGGWFGLDPAFAYERLQMEVSQAQDKMEVKQSPSLTEENQFALEIDHFSECIMQNKQPYTPGEEGHQDHLIIEAIYESARTGRPVKLEKATRLDATRGPEPKES